MQINVPELAGWVGMWLKASVEDDVAVEIELSGVIFIVGVEADVTNVYVEKGFRIKFSIETLEAINNE